MNIQKLGHSCLLIEKEGTKILIDPGAAVFMGDAFQPTALTGIVAILITHEHADHTDATAIKEILSHNEAVVFSNSGVKAVLEKSGIAVELFESGERQIGNFTVKATPAAHEALVVPVPTNTAYTIDGRFLTAGDSFNASLYAQKGIEVLALPIFAPWMRQLDAAEFAKQMQPKVVVPVHDGIVVPILAERQRAMWQKYFADQGIDCRILSPTDTLEI